jgi:hypothetical protein
MSDLAAWDSFYVIVGSVAGALIGLQFVVVTLIAQKPTRPSPDGSAAFGTPTVVHFGTALLLAALSRVPWPTMAAAAVAWGVVGCGGIVYVAIVLRRMRRQAVYEPEFEDLVVPRRVADGRLCRAGRVGCRDRFAPARGSVWDRRRIPAVALHRHP